jgi:hypothetical protein
MPSSYTNPSPASFAVSAEQRVFDAGLGRQLLVPPDRGVRACLAAGERAEHLVEHGLLRVWRRSISEITVAASTVAGTLFVRAIEA